MGLYDDVSCYREDCKCSEGHDLSGSDFQTKDLGCGMGAFVIEETLTGTPGDYGDEIKRPFLGRVSFYTTCKECPAFVQARTYNLVGMWVTFEAEIVYDKVVTFTRISPDTKDWLVNEPQQPFMDGCFGPMSYNEAYNMHIDNLLTKF